MELKYIVGNNIKETRTKNKDTQVSLAEKLGASPITISGWETGKKEPGFTSLEKIASLYGIRVSDLFNDEKSTSVQAIAFTKHDFVQSLCAAAASNRVNDIKLVPDEAADGRICDYNIVMTIERDYFNEAKELLGLIALITAYKKHALSESMFNSAIYGVLENMQNEDNDLPF